MLNKPKFNLFNNTFYGLEGLKEIFQNEVSFKIQLVIFFILSIFVLIIDLSYVKTSILIFSTFLPLICEVINSAIERTVDLVTLEHNELAKRAKDAGAALVLMAYFLVFMIWLSVLFY